MAPFRVLILGGYGVFGSRVARLLSKDGRLHVIVAGRRETRAQALCLELERGDAAAEISPLAFDRQSDLPAVLSARNIDLVIDASGPFQDQDYRVPEACIARGVDYCDLADGREFVDGFDQLNDAAVAAGVVAVTGASTTPALSSAVVDHLVQDMSAIDEIAVGVTPGNQAPRGLSLVQAILSYAGQKMPRWQDSEWRSIPGWQDLQRVEVGSLGRRWFSACDAPDVAFFPTRYEGVRTVTFHAGLELSILHLGLWTLSGLVRLGLISSLKPAARPLKAVADLMKPFGSDRGGMFVRVRGSDGEGTFIQKMWTLVAAAGDGPWVPALAAMILTGKLASQQVTFRGAGPCMGLIELGDFERAFAGLKIETKVETVYRQN